MPNYRGLIAESVLRGLLLLMDETEREAVEIPRLGTDIESGIKVQ